MMPLVPADVSLNAALAISAVAFFSGTARGFSGFGSALIFINVSAYWLRAVIGLLILITVLADMLSRRRRSV